MHIEREYKTATLGPSWKRKWWMRSREIDAVDGFRRYEMYSPWWAWPLELIHRIVFGYTRLSK
jgi:hypothetical protein